MDWFENEDFWRDLYPYLFAPDRISSGPEDVSRLLALASFTGSNVLDLCCGPGRHSVEFARRGFNVTGVDRSAFLLDRARERASEAAVSVEWVHEDMRRFRRPESFDLACNLYTSFGYFEDPEDDLYVLRNVQESLKPAGVFVLEMLGKERLAHVLQNSICTDFPDGAMLLQRPQIRNDWSRVSNEWILLKDGQYRTFRFEHTVYSGRELKERLTSAGFADVKLFGDLAGAPYGPDAARLVAVAQKTL